MLTVRRVPGRWAYADDLIVTDAGDMWRRLLVAEGASEHDAWRALLDPICDLSWSRWLS